MIITISGTPGSGKSTVGKLLAKKLGFRYFSIGSMRRAMARERGLTLQQFNVLGERQAFTDREIDAWQAKLGRQRDRLVVEGRTSFHFIPHSVKVFLSVSMAEAARRIWHDRAHARRFEASHTYRSPKELEHGLRGRIASDTRRYRKYYRLNIFLKRHYDLWLDTSRDTPRQTLGRIMTFLREHAEKTIPVEKTGIKRKPSTGRVDRLRKISGKKFVLSKPKKQRK